MARERRTGSPSPAKREIALFRLTHETGLLIFLTLLPGPLPRSPQATLCAQHPLPHLPSALSLSVPAKAYGIRQILTWDAFDVLRHRTFWRSNKADPSGQLFSNTTSCGDINTKRIDKRQIQHGQNTFPPYISILPDDGNSLSISVVIRRNIMRYAVDTPSAPVKATKPNPFGNVLCSDSQICGLGSGYQPKVVKCHLCKFIKLRHVVLLPPKVLICHKHYKDYLQAEAIVKYLFIGRVAS